MVKTATSKAVDDVNDDFAGKESRSPRKAAAKAHLAWEPWRKDPKAANNKPLAAPKPARKGGKLRATYEAAHIPNSDEEDEVPKMLKIGPPKKAKRAKPPQDDEYELEDVDEGEEAIAVSKTQQVKRRRSAAGSTKTSSRQAQDDDEELRGFEEPESDNDLVAEGYGMADVDEEGAEVSEPEDDLGTLVNNPRALEEKFGAEEKQSGAEEP